MKTRKESMKRIKLKQAAEAATHIDNFNEITELLEETSNDEDAVGSDNEHSKSSSDGSSSSNMLDDTCKRGVCKHINVCVNLDNWLMEINNRVELKGITSNYNLESI